MRSLPIALAGPLFILLACSSPEEQAEPLVWPLSDGPVTVSTSPLMEHNEKK